MSNLDTHYISGEQGTTGREPFEDTSNINQSGGLGQTTGAGFGGGYGQGAGAGGGGGYGQGLKDDFSSGGASYGQAPAVSGQHIGTGAGPGIGGEHHGHHHGHHGHHGGQTGEYAAGTAVGTGVGTGASQAVGGEGHHSHHGGHHDRQQHSHHQSGVPGPGSTNPTGEGYGGIGASEGGSHVDRVGPQGQGQAAYERTGPGGPATSGAAGTDRFDTGPSGAAHGSAEGQDTSQRAPGKGLGGVEGVLGTSDKDFTGRDRTGGGAISAYADTDGPFDSNASGPKGNSALTGREGNLENNPVAQAKSNETGTTRTTGTTGSNNTAVEDDGHEKKGLMDKIKDVLHK